MNHSGNQYDETIPLVREDMRDNGNRRRVDVEDKKVSGEQARQHGMRTVFGTSCTRWDDHTGSSSLTLSTDKNDDCMSLISGENGLKSSALLSTPSMATGVSHYRGILTAGKRWWSISKLWFISEDRYKARAYAGSAVLLSILTTLLLLKISDVQSGFSSALSEKKEEEFYLAVRDFIGIIVVAAPLFAINQYIDSRIAVEWRSWLARRLINSYFASRSYFHLKTEAKGIDNPDQRICDDVRSYANSSVILAVGVLRQGFYCVAFAGLLASLAPKLVWFLFGYAAVGTWITSAGFGKKLTNLSFSLLQREADLRFDLVRVREHAESVAFYRAGAREAHTALNRLETAVGVARSQILLQSFLSLWQNVYGYATILIPSLLMAPKYFSGEIRFGTISQVSFAFNRIEAAASYIINHLDQLASLAAETDRLQNLLVALDEINMNNSSPGINLHRVEQGKCICLPTAIEGPKGDKDLDLSKQQGQAPVVLLKMIGVTLCTPHGERVLCRNLNLHLTSGQSLLLIGPSGVGKSSLLRAIAGLWRTGSGNVTTPPESQIFFLPQKPYMPLGTLRQQLTLPEEPQCTIGEDANLSELLSAVCLPDLVQRIGGLDVECDWASLLSVGEQQRVAFLRLLRRRPLLAFLDEATSGVDPENEAKLYETLKKTVPCFCSVGHRRELLRWHSHVLVALENGDWELRTTAEHLRQVKE